MNAPYNIFLLPSNSYIQQLIFFYHLHNYYSLVYQHYQLSVIIASLCPPSASVVLWYPYSPKAMSGSKLCSIALTQKPKMEKHLSENSSRRCQVHNYVSSLMPFPSSLSPSPSLPPSLLLSFPPSLPPSTSLSPSPSLSPAAAKLVFDRCITKQRFEDWKRGGYYFKTHYNYEFLEDFQDLFEDQGPKFTPGPGTQSSGFLLYFFVPQQGRY